MSVEDNIDDVLFLIDNENRKRILIYLRDRNDYAFTREIHKALGIKMADVNFYCGQLVDKKIIEKRLVSRKARWKVNEKGLKVMQEVDKREGVKKTKDK